MCVFVFVCWVAKSFCLLSCHSFFKAFLNHANVTCCFEALNDLCEIPSCILTIVTIHETHSHLCITCVVCKEDEKMI